MKILIILSILVWHQLALAVCDKRIDPSKVILFIDTNYSDLEIATSEKAACQRGEKLIVVPKNYKDYTKLIANFESSKAESYRCKNNCEEVAKKSEDSFKELENFRKSQPEIKQSTEDALKELKSQGKKIQTLMISGHNGGGAFSGNKGAFTRYELAEMMKIYPELNDVKSLLLLGCYTGVSKEVLEWKKIFPEAKMIAGYDSSGPLSVRPLGHQYITELLTKEKDILAAANQAELQSYTKENIKSMHQLLSAVYVKCDLENKDDNEFYYASQAPVREFNSFSMKECLTKTEELKKIQDETSLYDSGLKEIPKDTAGGEIRQLLNSARALEHCADMLDMNIDTNKIFNLLFYDAVKENFSNFYEADSQRAEEIIETINLEDFLENFKIEYQKREISIKAREDELKVFEANPDAYFKKMQDEISKVKSMKAKLEEKYPFLKNLRTNMSFLTFNESLTKEEHKAKNDFRDLVNEQMILDAKMQNVPYAIENLRFEINDHKKIQENDLLVIEKIKQNPDMLKVWAPTKENMMSKSRTELMSNLHRINGLLGIPGLNEKQKNSLYWINNAKAAHLKNFDNPFSWHEVLPGNVEHPYDTIKLENTVYEGPMFSNFN